MRRTGSGPASPAPLDPAPHRTSENKELLRQQLLSASKERADRQERAKPKHSRNRQKNRWKLKFHHQALPQEYLDHYEQSLQKASAKQHRKPPEKPKVEPNIEINNFTNETFKIWAQRLAEIQNETGSQPVPQMPSVLSMAAKPKHEDKKKKNPAIAPSKIMTYEDLPYMGEMTLNNSKPRRGRKPKKADICHLIYENYGTVVPGQPPPQDRPIPLGASPALRGAEPSPTTSKTDLQNKIISNLLERKLSQENRRRLEILSPPRFCSPDEPMPEAPRTAAGPLHSDDEPLNLCIRDLHDLKIQIQKKFGNIYSSLPEVKVEADAETCERVDLKTEQPNAISVIQRNTNIAPATASSSPDLSRQTRVASPALSEPAQSTPGGDGDDKFPSYVYWPNAGIYMHPLALHTQLLYYQRLAAGAPGEGPPGAPRGPDEPLSGGSEGAATEPSSPDGNKKLVLKQISELLDPKVIKRVEEAKTPDTTKAKRASPNPGQGPVKRKRSAIFIPPIPTRTSSTPTTEVSICKFKFTGGSKPSLQEKKMLSVDSGGNFRYYSGTGAKGGAPRCALPSEPPPEPAPPLEPDTPPAASLGKDDLQKKKRKSRKTLQREKLEQTFKEKGFLIQTQQLQSAEGATYCKFRQLRKFTRYLFRSWKDYLPGELDDRPPEDAPDTPPTPHPAPGLAEWG
ncbi:PREDICTED: uncharacterized protein LOC106116695 isoform X2 [Papilio xuthus]|nr:PREDICTED: uncharacterized protein LOC106116695 isoform X2 [Papilio xuthus]XP_013166076.1 PREDICTED: uncharacterized protein LOC106116695 isoform X2 [Papilio xuthus]XP_013166077.1 PREDICTED: uncharacterized protein LOC106116695 isoform X2 [Papilio xuthus]XP_013166078.1 PREDICTED: uncharacterized protein LOC106116695 isoform X2 [Papilio xuthus]XP_013166079.1 PREDICTED: uncharacterized protein LOC106116695 isoform X2 [Papilio xuthus]